MTKDEFNRLDLCDNCINRKVLEYTNNYYGCILNGHVHYNGLVLCWIVNEKTGINCVKKCKEYKEIENVQTKKD